MRANVFAAGELPFTIASRVRVNYLPKSKEGACALVDFDAQGSTKTSRSQGPRESASQEEAEGIHRIPRQFHRIWLGGPMPDEFARFGETWLEKHPGWVMRQWGDDNLPHMRNQILFDEAETFSGKADVLRYELLWQFGGIYIDTDFECLKSIEPLLEKVQVFASFESDWSVNNALMGAVPEHPFIEMLIDALPNSVSEHGITDPVISYGPGFLNRCLKAWDEEGGEPVMLFPASYFYPYLWHEKHRRFEKFPEAYAVHRWALSWHPPRTGIKQRIRNGLMRYWITRRAFYLNAWIQKRLGRL